MRLVLDAEAVSALVVPSHRARPRVATAVAAAYRADAELAVPAVALADACASSASGRAVAELLSTAELEGIRWRDTDLAFARLVGIILAHADAGSQLLVAAHLVATALEGGGGVILTAQPTAVSALGAPYPGLAVEAI